MKTDALRALLWNAMEGGISYNANTKLYGCNRCNAHSKISEGVIEHDSSCQYLLSLKASKELAKLEAKVEIYREALQAIRDEDIKGIVDYARNNGLVFPISCEQVAGHALNKKKR